MGRSSKPSTVGEAVAQMTEPSNEIDRFFKALGVGVSPRCRQTTGNQGMVQVEAVESRVDEVEKRQEKTAIEQTRTALQVQQLTALSTIGIYVGLSVDGVWTKVGFGDSLDARVKFRQSNRGGSWIIKCKTYGLLQSYERRLHKQLALRHEVAPGCNEIYLTTPELLADLRLAGVLDAEITDADFLQGELF